MLDRKLYGPIGVSEIHEILLTSYTFFQLLFLKLSLLDFEKKPSFKLPLVIGIAAIEK